jgi:predicted RNase H-like HicB family nuclease
MMGNKSMAEQMGIASDAFSRLQSLERQVEELSVQVAQLGESRPSVIPITTLAPEPYALVHDIPVVLQSAGDGFTATYFDANLATSGDTPEEALANLKELILDVFEDLESDEDRLGPEPARQLAVLRSVMRRVAGPCAES